MKKSEDRIKVLFIPGLSTSFIKNDFKNLQKYFDVTLVQWRGKRDLFNLFKGIMRNDLAFIWFASDHAGIAVFLAKLFRKKTIVIAGGYDFADIPELNYGQFTLSWHKRFLTKFALKNADAVLPVSNYSNDEILKRVPTARSEVVYNGVDTKIFKPKKKEKLVVTIGPVKRERLKLKGLTTFSEVSVNFPGYKFVIIGGTEEPLLKELKKINSSLIFTGKIPHEKVVEWLQRATVYCQLSYIESFGMGVAEAMSCECIPVVTKRGGLPEVVGDVGFYVTYGDVKSTAEAIDKAIKASKETRNKARERIEKLFPFEKREERLIDIIRSLMKKC